MTFILIHGFDGLSFLRERFDETMPKGCSPTPTLSEKSSVRNSFIGRETGQAVDKESRLRLPLSGRNLILLRLWSGSMLAHSFKYLEATTYTHSKRAGK